MRFEFITFFFFFLNKKGTGGSTLRRLQPSSDNRTPAWFCLFSTCRLFGDNGLKLMRRGTKMRSFYLQFLNEHSLNTTPVPLPLSLSVCLSGLRPDRVWIWSRITANNEFHFILSGRRTEIKGHLSWESSTSDSDSPFFCWWCFFYFVLFCF